MVALLALGAGALAAAGLVQQAVGSALAARMVRNAAIGATTWPPVTVLKPLHGSDPLLESALESWFVLDYPALQLVFGVADAADPALAVLARLQARYPHLDVAVVIDATRYGKNRKIGNLINMMPVAKHDILLIADADMHVASDYLRAVVTALQAPGVGLVTTLYTGLAGSETLAARVGVAQINYGFLPAASLARRLGRQDCLGATMALRRETLAAIGGLAALVEHLADDNVLGRLVRAQGLRIDFAPVIPATGVMETSLRDLWAHGLRWARTIRALVPIAYFGVILQFPLFWAGLALLLSGFSTGGLIGFGVLLLLRYALARRLERALRLRPLVTPWQLLVSDMLAAALFLASFFGDQVMWRGQMMHADNGQPKNGGR
ncbi:ceramide glucosyltransferase [Acidiphilium sp. MT5]